MKIRMHLLAPAPSRFVTKFSPALFAIVVLLQSVAPMTFAVEIRWQGDASDNWQAGTNWVGDNEPAATDEVWFNQAFKGGDNDPTIKNSNNDKRLDRIRVTNPNQAATITIASNRRLRLDKNGRSIDMRTAERGLIITGNGKFQQTDEITTPFYDLSGNGAGNLTISSGIFQVEGDATLKVNTSDGRKATFTTGITNGIGTTTSASLIKEGEGLLKLSGTNLHTGDTTVNGGILRVEGSMTQSDLTANAGRIEGGGTFGNVTITGTAVHGPGLSPGIDTVDGDYLLDGGTLEIELGGTTAGTGVGFHDQVFVDKTTGDGSVTLSNNPLLDIIFFDGFVPSEDDEFIILDNDAVDAVIGTFAGLDEGELINVAGFSDPLMRLQISYAGGTGNDVVLTAISVPEPASLALWLIIGATLSLLAVRHKQHD